MPQVGIPARESPARLVETSGNYPRLLAACLLYLQDTAVYQAGGVAPGGSDGGGGNEGSVPMEKTMHYQ